MATETFHENKREKNNWRPNSKNLWEFLKWDKVENIQIKIEGNIWDINFVIFESS